MPAAKLDEDLVRKMTDLIAAGNFVKTACAMLGISYTVHYKWMGKGRQRLNPLYIQYYESVTKAEAKLEDTVARRWMAKTEEDWHAAKEYLGRRFPTRWGESKTLKIENQNESVGLLPALDLSKLTTEELLLLEKLTRKATPTNDDTEGASDEESV